MALRVSRRLSLISGPVLVPLRSSSVIMPGTMSAIVCLMPISPRMSPAAVTAAGEGEGGAAAGAAGAAAGGVVSAAQPGVAARRAVAKERAATVRKADERADVG